MERIVHIAKNHTEARKWDVKQSTSMSPNQRQEIAKVLRTRAYGNSVKDVREYERQKKQDERV